MSLRLCQSDVWRVYFILFRLLWRVAVKHRICQVDFITALRLTLLCTCGRSGICLIPSLSWRLDTKEQRKECRLQGIRTLDILFWRLVSHWFSLYILYRFVKSYVWICSALIASASCDICPMIHSGFVACLGLPCQSVQMTVNLDVCACGASTRRRTTRDKGPPFVRKKHKGIQRDSFP